MNHCKDCRHWTVGAPSPRDEFEECALATSTTGSVDQHPNRLAIADVGADTPDGTATRLFTHPEFGCVQWEAP